MSQADTFPIPVHECTSPVNAVMAASKQSAQSLPLPIASAVPDSGQLWETLFKNFEYNFDAVYTVIDAILTAKDRCQMTPLYIQGIVTSSACFLTSNLGQPSQLHLTEVDTCWRLGRSADCALRMAHPAIDICHAAIHYDADTGFRLADLGSAAGLRHNRHRLPSLTKRQLRDGDLLEIGTLRIEFFIDDFRRTAASLNSPSTYF